MKDINNMSDIEIMAINKMYLEDKIKKLEEKPDEKDRKIERLHNYLINKQYEFNILQDKQLYKEDFKEEHFNLKYANKGHDNCEITYVLKDNPDYNKLPSREELNNE